jgi:2-polyprenyl-3-methyl-5-hydroxy-6-metoxy-1,4-benzoquinol methylase
LRIDVWGGPIEQFHPREGTLIFPPSPSPLIEAGQTGIIPGLTRPLEGYVLPMSQELVSKAVAGALRYEETGCLLCGSNRWSVVLEAEDGDRLGTWFRVVRCKQCGLCFTNPRPDSTCIGQFYPTNYKPHRQARAVRRGLGDWLGRLRGVDPERFGPPWHGERRLLDVGCGSGSFLQRMHQRGWSVLGVDVAQQAVDYVRDALRLPALQGSLPHPTIPPASFDVVTSWQCLEHVHQPLELLRGAYEALVPGGRLYLSVPNIASAPFRWFGPDWFALDVPRHLTHFTPHTLGQMLTAAGFEVQSLRCQRSTAWIRHSALLSHHRRGTGRCPWLRLRPVARLASWYAHLRRESDCLLAVAVRPG